MLSAQSLTFFPTYLPHVITRKSSRPCVIETERWIKSSWQQFSKFSTAFQVILGKSVSTTVSSMPPWEIVNSVGNCMWRMPFKLVAQPTLAVELPSFAQGLCDIELIDNSLKTKEDFMWCRACVERTKLLGRQMAVQEKCRESLVGLSNIFNPDSFDISSGSELHRAQRGHTVRKHRLRKTCPRKSHSSFPSN